MERSCTSLEINGTSTDEDMVTYIDSYIELSPLTSKFREENPNLQSIEVKDAERRSDIPIDTISTNESPIPIGHKEKNSPTSKLKHKMKRLSLIGQNHSNVSNDGLDKKHKRFSLNLPRSRLSSSSSAGSSSHFYRASGSSRSSLSVKSSMSNTESDELGPNFWKYHILKFGKDLYLTTNPTLKHVYCRNGPGYYVEIQYFGDPRNPSSKNGYSLTFRDVESMEMSKKKEPIMKVTKKPETEGGYFTIAVHCLKVLKKGEIEASEDQTFKGLSLPVVIDPKFIPDEIIDDANHSYLFKNYEFKDFHDVKWDIGSIPRVRSSKMKKLRTKMATVPRGLNEKEEVEEEESDYLKLVGKRNVYFHRNFQANGFSGKHSEDRPEEQKKCFYGDDIPKVLGLFRPYESKIHKKIIHSFNKSINKLHPKQQLSNRISSDSLQYDIGAGSEIHHYYKAGDGLYGDANPPDDSPDDNTLGWITLYEYPVLEGTTNKGMYDIVMGLTLAVGIETYLDF